MLFSDMPLAPNTRMALRVEYHGGAFNGWQAQTKLDVPTVQEALEAGLSKIAAAPIKTSCAGRTDTGVHASGQIVHFDDPVGRSLKSWVFGTNSETPDSISIHWAGDVASDFHARFSATSRRYRYIICNTPTKPAQLTGLVSHYKRPLDAELMNQAAQILVGENDFSAFRAASCQSSTPWRNMTSLSVSRRGDFVWVDLEANAFLHHMVRNIVGSLLLVGAGLRDAFWLSDVFHGKDRTVAGDTAVSAGLYLVGVKYPREFNIPFVAEAPAFMALSI
jgi:tRNA pseudouridine38-40 synthase